MSIQGRPSESESIQVVLAALERGMRLIDTADVYCLDQTDIGHNERLIAKALKEWRGEPVVVATKGGMERPGGSWTRNGDPRHLKDACERSLKALGVETITLYQLHTPDPRVPFEDSIGALAELQLAGKIRHVGLSNVNTAQIEEARSIVPIVSVQNRANVLDRSSWHNGVVAYCEREKIAFLPYCPVGGGRQRAEVGAHPVLTEIGKQHGATPYQVALAWLLQKSPVAVPIPGASKVTSARSSADAMKLTLTAEQLKKIDALA